MRRCGFKEIEQRGSLGLEKKYIYKKWSECKGREKRRKGSLDLGGGGRKGGRKGRYSTGLAGLQRIFLKSFPTFDPKL